jgi:hypothetical protein
MLHNVFLRTDAGRTLSTKRPSRSCSLVYQRRFSVIKGADFTAAEGGGRPIFLCDKPVCSKYLWQQLRAERSYCPHCQSFSAANRGDEVPATRSYRRYSRNLRNFVKTCSSCHTQWCVVQDIGTVFQRLVRRECGF